MARTGEARRFEHYAAGLDRWFEVYASRIGAAGSHLVAVVFNNVTARKRAEEAVRTSEEKFWAIVDQTSVGICHADLSGRLTFANPTFCTLVGYDAAEVVGTTIWI